MRRRLALVGCVLLFGLAGAAWPAAAAEPTCSPGSGAKPTNLRNQQLQQASLACADLRGMDLSGVDLSQADLAGADLTGANLRGATLGQADLSHAILTGADAEHADFGQATMSDANLTGLDARYADFTQATLTGDDLSHADLTGATLDQAQADDTRLDGTHLAGASLAQISDRGATVLAPTGLVPVDALAGIAATVIAWFALYRWWRRPPFPQDTSWPRVTSGRIAAGVVAGVVLVGLVVSVVGAWGWVTTTPTDSTWFAPLVLVFLLVAGIMLVITSVRRVRAPGVAAALAAVGALGQYLMCAAALAGLLHAMEVSAFTGACSGVDCAGGLTRGWAGFALGIALLAVVVVVARLPGVTRPGSGIAWRTTVRDADEVWY